MALTRKEFLVAAGSAAVVAACGSSEPQQAVNKDLASGDCKANGTEVSIIGNHGHALSVSKEDVVAGVAKTHTSTGSACHTHTLQLTAQDFAKLQMGQAVSVTSGVGGGHTHDIGVACC